MVGAQAQSPVHAVEAGQARARRFLVQLGPLLDHLEAQVSPLFLLRPLSYLIESVYEIVLQTSFLSQILQLVLYMCNNKDSVHEFVGELTF